MRLTGLILGIALLAGCEAAAPVTSSAPEASPTPAPGATVIPGSHAPPTVPPQAGASPSETPPASPPATAPVGVASPSAAPAQPTMTPVGPPAEPGSLEWSRVSGDGLGLVFDALSGSYHAAVVGDSFVLLGYSVDPTGDGNGGVAWRSSDGRRWTDASLPGADDWSSVSGLAVGRLGLVAVGTDDRADPVRALVWLSADGVAWERIDDPDFELGAMRHVAATPEGFIAFGNHVWVSENGRDWSRSSSASAAAVREGLDSPRSTIIAHDGRLTAFASAGGRIEVWRSAALEEWELIARLPRSAGSIASAAVRGPLGWLVAGLQDTGQTPLWTSADGETWEAIPGFGPVTDLLAHDAGYVAVGYEQIGTGCATSEDEVRGLTWTSVDGLTWTESSRRGWAHQRVDELLLVGSQLIGVGITYRDGAWGEGAVWTAPLPSGGSNDPSEPAPTDETAHPGCGGPGD